MYVCMLTREGKLWCGLERRGPRHSSSPKVLKCLINITRLFLKFYSWCTMFWDVVSEFNLFHKLERILSIFSDLIVTFV